jgi:hypothetical protein
MKNKNEEFKDELSFHYSLLINTERKEQRKRTIIILIIFSITLISVLISTIYSYKAYKSTKDILSNNKVESKKYFQTLSVVYSGGHHLNLDGLFFGYELPNPLVISITNDGDYKINYKISINNISTNLASNSNLYYTITKNNETSSPKILPVKDDDLLTELTISPKETASYIIKANYTGIVPEGESMFYHANISVIQTNSDSSLLE